MIKKLFLISAIVAFLASLALSGCAQPAPAPVPTPPTTEPAPAPAPAPEPTPATTQPPTTFTQEDIDDAKQVVFEYWDAFNNYDAEGALAYLEESYRPERAESIKSDIGRMQSFGAKLGVEEESEPTITSEGEVEIKIKLSTPLGAKHVTYHLVKVNGEWKICLSERE